MAARYFVWQHIAHTPGDLISQIRAALVIGLLSATPEPNVFDLSLVDHHGYRAVRLRETPAVVLESEDVSDHIFVLVSLTSDVTAPTRFFTDSPGWSAHWTHSLYGGYDTPELFQARHTEYLILRAVLIEQWGRGTFNSGELRLAEDVGLKTKQWTRTEMWNSYAEQLVSWDKCTLALKPPDTADTFYQLTQVAPALVPSGGVTIIHGEFPALVQAVQDLAKLDTTIAFDEGRTVVSNHGSEVESA